MRRLRLTATLATAAALAVLAGGCALSPWEPDTLAPIERFESRITEGPGTTIGYHPELTVEPGSTVQVRTLIGDGKAVVYTIPSEPTSEAEITVEVEGDESETQTIPISGAGGAEFVLENPTAFDPGYLGVERLVEDGELTLRVIAPRLTGTGQGQARFSFKLDVSPP